MVVHCYLYKLRDRSDAEKARTALLRMKDHIKEIKEMKVGIDFVGAGNSFDVVQISKFETQEDFVIFGKHPYHAEVREYMNQLTLQSARVDCEI